MIGQAHMPRGYEGKFVRCVQIHEGELEVRNRDIKRTKKDGTYEWVNAYTIFGKERPALVLRELDKRHGLVYSLVWYTCTCVAERRQSGDFDVSAITEPSPPKRAFLRPQAGQIRAIPHTPAWGGEIIGIADKGTFPGLLEAAQKCWSLRL